MTLEIPQGGVRAQQLRGLVERIERLKGQRAMIDAAIEDVYAQAKGFDPEALRRLIAIREREVDDLADVDALAEVYRRALGPHGSGT